MVIKLVYSAYGFIIYVESTSIFTKYSSLLCLTEAHTAGNGINNYTKECKDMKKYAMAFWSCIVSVDLGELKRLFYHISCL